MSIVGGILRQKNSIRPWLLPALAFSLPISTSMVTVLALLIATWWLLEGGYREKCREIVANPVAIAALGYLGCTFWDSSVDREPCLWVEDPAGPVEAYDAAAVPDHAPYWGTGWVLAAFIAGVTSVLLLLTVAWLGLLPFGGVSKGAWSGPPIFWNHIVFTPMLAWASYLSLHQLLWHEERRLVRWALLLLAGFLAWGVFITTGRAGQLVFLVLVAVLIFQFFRRNALKAALVAGLSMLLIAVLAYWGSEVFRTRLDGVRQDLATLDRPSDQGHSSTGSRLHFWQNSLKIIAQHPWFGVGTGGFAPAYAQIDREQTQGRYPAGNPHNQYLMVTVQLGLAGLFCLLGILAAQLQQARSNRDGWERLRLAFPLFFAVIMLTDSYLNTSGSGFLFSLLSAVLFKRAPQENDISAGSRPCATGERYWLVLSYRANINASACSYHIDDRLPLLVQAGITPVLLTGPLGARSTQFPHYRTWSLAPSGIRSEIRYALRRRFHRRWQFKLIETILLLPVLPFYLLEKIIINIESEWSWWMTAAFRGLYLQWRYRPEVLYSTGGSSAAHVAGRIIQQLTGVRWIAEVQDPLVCDQDWTRSQRVYRLYRWLEQQIAKHSQAFIFLAQGALEHARHRIGHSFPGFLVHAGAPVRTARHAYVKGDHCRFGHFGSLSGSRNLLLFFEALVLLFQEDPEARRRVRLDLYGSCDEASRKLMQRVGFEDLVTFHAQVDRPTVHRAMEEMDCLLMIQNTSYAATEMIPSKTYEYLQSARPILGLVHQNPELAGMLAACGHTVVKADDSGEIKAAVREILQRQATTSFTLESVPPQEYTVDRAVNRLIELAVADKPRNRPEPQSVPH